MSRFLGLRGHRRVASDLDQACRLPWEIGLAETHQTLVMNGLRARIAVQVDGSFAQAGTW